VRHILLAHSPFPLSPIRLFLIMLCLILLLLLVAASVPLAAGEVDNQVADRCHQILESSVINFYLPHCIDTENGV